MPVFKLIYTETLAQQKKKLKKISGNMLSVITPRNCTKNSSVPLLQPYKDELYVDHLMHCKMHAQTFTNRVINLITEMCVLVKNILSAD